MDREKRPRQDLVSTVAGPEPIRAHAARVFADTVGAIVGGGRRPEIERLVAGDRPLLSPLAGGSVARLLVPGFPGADPTAAALANGAAANFLEPGEGYRSTGHPATRVVLAAAQTLHASGREFSAAFLAGSEITVRLFEAHGLIYPPHPHGPSARWGLRRPCCKAQIRWSPP